MKKTMRTPTKAEISALELYEQMINRNPMSQEKKDRLREDYTMRLEERLDEIDRSHWGKTLQVKVQKYPNLAQEVLESWAFHNDIVLASSSIFDCGRCYENSSYGVLLRTLDEL